MGTHLRNLILVILLPLLTFANWQMDFDELWATAGKQPKTLTFQYVSTYPASITIGGSLYGQPADPSKALVDAGDGVFVPWTSNTITLKGKQVRFRGDWRNSNGCFRELFFGTFGSDHLVTMSGGFDFEGAPVVHVFSSTFRNCPGLTGPIPVGLFGDIFGAPAANMFHHTFNGCYRLTGSIPVGLFGDISGAPAASMFSYTFHGCPGLTGSIPVGLFGDICGAPVTYMFHSTFRDCTGLEGPIPVGLFGVIYGAPATGMFTYTFYGCYDLTGESALMPEGTTHLYEQFPTASTTHSGGCYRNTTGLDDYADIPTAWK